MTVYGVVTACYQLPDSFMIPDMMPFIREDKNFVRVFENSDTRTMRIINKGVKVEEWTVSVQETRDRETAHFILMKKLLAFIDPESTLMFIDISHLSGNAGTASILYMSFIDAGHVLKFVRSSWLNSDNFTLLNQTAKQETRQLISQMISNSLEVLHMDSESPNIDVKNTCIYQLPLEVKKKSQTAL